MLYKLLKSLPFRLLLCIIFAFLFGNYLNDSIIQALYTISFNLKEILMTILPIIIFSYIFAAILSFKKGAPSLIIFIILLVTLSNATSSFIAYFVGKATIPYIAMEASLNISIAQEITPYFSLNIPRIISSDKAMLSGLSLGILFCYFQNSFINRFAHNLQDLVTNFLKKCFIPLLPLYVLGFILKMHREGELSILFKNYSQVFIIICIVIISYIFLLYFVANKFSWKNTKSSLKEMMAAGLAGFSTISSAVTMPLTIAATEKNLKNKEYAGLVIPTTVNIHMIGHGLSIPITSLSILMLTGHDLPSLASFSMFVMYFCIAKFSASAVPGGGIIVILPILQSQLGFSPEMCSIIVMLDILQDAILTSANVMGNGAFAMISYRIYNKLKALGNIPK